MKQAIRINPTDNVAVAIKALKAGDIIDIEGSPLKLVTDVVPGHKIALNDIKTGEMIVKYGFPIGHAIHDIAKGALLDDHDIKTNLSGERTRRSEERALGDPYGGLCQWHCSEYRGGGKSTDQ